MESSFSAKEAVQVIDAVQGFEEGLRRRTYGITWLLWGFVGSGIAMTYAYAYLAVPHAWMWLFALLWIPWVAGGYLASFLLWRSVGIAIGAEPRAGRAFGLRVTLVSLVFLVLAFGGGALLGPLMGPGGYTLAAVGFFSGLAGLLRLRYAPVQGDRFILAAASFVLILAGIAVALWSPSMAVGEVAAAIIGGGVYLAAGSIQTLRG